MKSDTEIKKDVLDELRWQPNIDETQIGVIVDDGVVALKGVVDSYAKKITVEKAVKFVKRVKEVVNDVEVSFSMECTKTDKKIAKAAARALEWNVSVPEDKILIKVDDGEINVTGELQWNFQKEAAITSLENLKGVKSVVNNLKLKQSIEPTEIKLKISKAFKRLADLDENNIKIEVEGHKVRLKGKVHSYAEKEEAKKTAFFAPGVYEIENELEVVN